MKKKRRLGPLEMTVLGWPGFEMTVLGRWVMRRRGGARGLGGLWDGPVGGRGIDVVEVGFSYEGFDDAFDDGVDDEARGGFHEGVEEGGHFERGGEATRKKTARRAKRDFSLRKPTISQE